MQFRIAVVFTYSLAAAKIFYVCVCVSVRAL